MSSRCLRSLLLVLPLLAVACGEDSDGGPPPAAIPPTVREIQPTGGPIAGNTLINVYGSGFQDGAKLYLGEQEALRTVVVNSFRIYGYTPTATSAKVDVRVVNPDGAYGVLVKGFTFEGPPSSTVDQAEVLNGNREEVSNGQPVGVVVEGSITVAGLTRGTGQGPGVRAQVGFAPGTGDVLNQESYTWEEATYTRDSDSGEADIYKGNVLLQAPIGIDSREWVIAIRFSLDGGRTWVMADGDGVANGLSASLMRRVFIARPQVDYCKLGPDNNRASLSIFYRPTDEELTKVVGQVYSAGVTPGSGAGSGLIAQLGWGPANSDPRDANAGWTWTNATYGRDIGNNDEWEADLPNPGTLGTWRVAMRFSVRENVWHVCDVNGVNDSTEGDLTFDLNRLGILTVANEPPKPPVEWCKLGENNTPPEELNYQLTTSGAALRTVFAQVYMTGVTPPAGAGPGLVAELGHGPSGSDPRDDASGWTWAAMTFNRDQFGANDEWKGTLLNPGTLGNYSYAVRFRVNGGPNRVCDGNGHNDEPANPFELDQLGKLSVTGEPIVQRVVGYCKLGADGNNTPETVNYVTGAQGDRVVRGQVFVQGVTAGAGAGTGVVGQLGWGPGSDPTSAQWNWTTTGTYRGEVGNNDEFQATLPNPDVVGTYRFAYRFQVNGGAFLYCDADGNTGTATGFSAAMMGTLNVSDEVVVPRVVGYCKLGPDGNNTPESVTYATNATANRTVVGQVYVEGVTAGAGAGTGVVGQLGWGPTGEDPATSAQWNWATSATYRGEIGNNDEFEATLPNPGAEGSYRFAYRFQVNGGSFLLCDADGNSGSGFDPALLGTLTVSPPQAATIDWCRLGGETAGAPPSETYTVGEAASKVIAVQLHEAGVTNGTGAGAGITAELGYGPAGVDPADAAWSWTAAAFGADTGADANDEYRATLPNPGTEGSYRFTYRVRVGTGPFTYCDADGTDDGFDLADVGTLAVQAPPDAPFCRLQSVSGTTVGSGDAVTVTGRVHIPGVTNGDGPGANLQVQVGLGAVDVNASTSPEAFTWKAAAYSREAADEEATDEFSTVIHPAYTGDREVSLRYSTDGESWTYCDKDGSDVGGYTAEQQHALTVNNHTDINYCNLQWPFSMPTTGGDRTVYGQVYEPGVTDSGGAGAGLTAELGYGSASMDPGVSGWTWTAAPYGSDSGNNDQFALVLPDLPAGTSYMYRYSLNGGPYCYGDRNDRGDSGNGVQGSDLGTVAP